MWTTKLTLALCALLASVPAAATAQRSTDSPVDGLLDRITADINDLQYAQAIQRGQPLAVSASAMPLAQRLRWRLLMAAAFYPEERQHQNADSATMHLTAAVRIAPDARYIPEMRWRGLDSLLERARARTLAVVARAVPSQLVGGADTPLRVEAVASRAVQLRLRLVDRATGRAMPADTATGQRAEFSVSAHDGRRVLLAPGTYDLEITALDPGRESTDARYELVVEGTVIVLQPEPPILRSALLAERTTVARGRSIAAGLVFSGATLAVATLGRSDASLRERHPTDARAFVVSAAMLIGVTAVLWKQKGAPLPMNVAANAKVRAARERAADSVITANRVRLSTYRVTVRLAPEPR